jgi:hypothetical protein
MEIIRCSWKAAEKRHDKYVFDDAAIKPSVSRQQRVGNSLVEEIKTKS